MARIAPERLTGREAELAELAEFCVGDSHGPYRWWRAPAWAGKSALVATFALRPLPGIRLASFFITARYAGQNDRVAFADVLIREFAEILAVPVPDITDATRDLVLLDLMGLAAADCRSRGQRLILLVDGLDEDRGVTTGHDAYSIAALLPSPPPDGMRVIVTGRPNPPIPDDVPDAHLLRNPAIVRVLEPSPEAATVGEAMRRELASLLDGSEIERELLGFITAAGGGLSTHDLHELTGVDARTVRQHLNTVAGRSFTPRPSTWKPGTEPDVYLLGHEELQLSAADGLGPERLAGYRRRIFSWADEYRRRGWPPGTPEYLLRGYFGLLQATGELSKMVECAADPLRHDRMLDITGGDLAATAEIGDAMDAVVATDEPDLLAMIHLAMQRDRMNERNSRTPRALPAVWETLGRQVRADTVAHSIADTVARCDALMRMARVAQHGGHGVRAQALVDEAAALADGETKEYVREWAREVIAAPGRAGREATRVFSTHEHRRRWMYVRAPELVASGGDYDDAEALARAAGKPYLEVEALIRIGRTALAAADHDRAWALARSAATIARAAGDPRALSMVAAFMGLCGKPAPGEGLVRLIQSPHQQASAMFRLIRPVAESGATRRAERMASALPEPYLRAWAFIDVAAATGDRAEAARLLAAAEADVARVKLPAGRDWLHRRLAAVRDGARPTPQPQIRAPFVRAHAMKQLVETAAESGERSWAGELVKRGATLAAPIPDLVFQAEILTDLAGLDAGHGDPEHAAELAERAGAVARTHIDPWNQARLWTVLHVAVTQTGRLRMCARIADRAESWIAHLLPYAQEARLSQLAVAIADSGDLARAVAIQEAMPDSSGAERLKRRLADPLMRETAAADLAKALAGAGDYRRARAVIDGIEDVGRRDGALVAVARTAAGTSAIEDAASAIAAVTAAQRRQSAVWELVEQVLDGGDYDGAFDLIALIAEPDFRAWQLGILARAAAARGHLDRAQAAINTMTQPERRFVTWQAIVEAASERGEHNQALAFADRIEDPRWRDSALADLARTATTKGDDRLAAWYTEAIANLAYRDMAVESLARTAAEAGDPGRADEWCQHLTRDVARDKVWADLAEIAERAGDHERSERLLSAIRGGSQRADAFTRVISVAVHADELDRARGLAERMGEDSPAVRILLAAAAGDYRSVTKMREEMSRPWTPDGTAQLARIAASRGDFEAAAVFAASDPFRQAAADSEILRFAAVRGDAGVVDGNRVWHPQALETVLQECVDQGRYEMAEVFSRTLENSARRAAWTAKVAVAWAADDDTARAAYLLETLPGGWRGTTYVDAAAAAAEKGYLGTAEDLICLIEDPRDRFRALTQVAALTDGLGDHERAEEWIAALAPDERMKGLISLAVAAFRRGDRDRAEKLAAALPNGPDQERVWRDLAWVAATAGDLAEALVLCRRIADPASRADLLAAFARRSFVPASEKRRLLGWALRWGPWDATLSAMAAVDPDAVLAFAEQALASDGCL